MGTMVAQWASLSVALSNPTGKPQKYGMKCGGYCPDLLQRTPPDMPPAMGGLVIVEGEKDDMLPAARAVRNVAGGSGDRTNRMPPSPSTVRPVGDGVDERL